MEKKKYLIRNIGCDDSTWGICELTHNEFIFIENMFNELNKNSSYGCQPKIYIELATEDDLKYFEKEI